MAERQRRSKCVIATWQWSVQSAVRTSAVDVRSCDEWHVRGGETILRHFKVEVGACCRPTFDSGTVRRWTERRASRLVVRNIIRVSINNELAPLRLTAPRSAFCASVRSRLRPATTAAPLQPTAFARWRHVNADSDVIKIHRRRGRASAGALTLNGLPACTGCNGRFQGHFRSAQGGDRRSSVITCELWSSLAEYT